MGGGKAAVRKVAIVKRERGTRKRSKVRKSLGIGSGELAVTEWLLTVVPHEVII